MNANSIFSRGIRPNGLGNMDCTSHTSASLVTSSMGGAKNKSVKSENIHIFRLEFFSHIKLAMLGGPRTIKIE